MAATRKAARALAPGLMRIEALDGADQEMAEVR
jgi:hypothetical protein